MGYLREVYSSLAALARNPKMMLPDLVWILGIFLTNYLFFQTSGILRFIQMQDVLNQLLLIDWIRLIASITVLAFTQFFWGAGIETLRFTMVKDVTLGKKPSLLRAFKVKRVYLFRLIIVKALVYCIIIVAFLPMIGFGMIAKAYFGPVAYYIIIAFLAIAATLLVRIGLLFRHALLFIATKKAVEAVRLSFAIARKKLRHTFMVWLVITAGFLVIALFNSSIGSLFYLIRTESNLSLIAGIVISLLCERFYRIWESIYIFKNFKA
ncbi:MAG: hypothetical protein ABIB71_04550 [Candidatus Woesearchaeota archaeon]